MSDPAATDTLTWDLVDRLHKALRVGKCKPGEMTRILGVSPATMTNYLSGKSRPKDGMLRPWALRCGVPFDWLSTGVEPQDGDDPGGLEVSRRACNGAQVIDLRARRISTSAAGQKAA